MLLLALFLHSKACNTKRDKCRRESICHIYHKGDVLDGFPKIKKEPRQLYISFLKHVYLS